MEVTPWADKKSCCHRRFDLIQVLSRHLSEEDALLRCLNRFADLSSALLDDLFGADCFHGFSDDLAPGL